MIIRLQLRYAPIYIWNRDPLVQGGPPTSCNWGYNFRSRVITPVTSSYPFIRPFINGRGPPCKVHGKFQIPHHLSELVLRFRQSVIGCYAGFPPHPACQSSPSLSIIIHFPLLLGKHPKRYTPQNHHVYRRYDGGTSSTVSKLSC